MKKRRKSTKNSCGRWILSAGKHTGCSEGGRDEPGYGNCYGCGCCAKDKKQRYENRIRYLNGMIEEQEHFDNWFDEPEMRALQEKNRQANIKYFKKKLAYYTKKLKKLEG